MAFKHSALLTFLCLLATAYAHAGHGGDTNGMDMSMDSPMNLASGHMLMYFHTTPGDILWFEGWVPQSTGAMVGACIGLFLLALVDRWVAACRGMMEMHWKKRAQIEFANRQDARGDLKRSSDFLKNTMLMRNSLPFIPAHDIVRGVMQLGQAALGYALMLAVMTYQVGFIIAIVVGLGVGETLFGRFSTSAHVH